MNMKRIMCAALSALVLLTGCSGERMEPVEYAQAVMESGQEYFDMQRQLTYDAVENGLERSEFKAIRKEAEAVLKTIRRLSAPEEYSELHEQLCDGVERELEWLELAEKLCYSDDDKMDELSAEIEQLVSDPVFPMTVLEIGRAVDKDTDGAFLETLR